MLKHFTINGYRGFANLELAISDRITVIAGPNGTGKSSILQALALVYAHTTGQLTRPRGLSTYDRHLGANDVSFFIDHDGIRGDISIGKTSVGLSTFRAIPTGYTCLYYSNLRHVVDVPLRIRDGKSATAKVPKQANGELNFRKFFAEFRRLEDEENEKIRDDAEYRDPILTAVRHAIASFLPGYTDLRIRRNPLRMEIRKEATNVRLRIEQLSDGEKCLLALVGDIAMKLAQSDPEKRLAAQGLVLIDEIDLFLHPVWQSTLVEKFKQTFPQAQFVMTTHSPEVLSDLLPSEIRLLYYDEGKISVHQPTASLGLYHDEIVSQLFGVRPINTKIESRVNRIGELIEASNFDEARQEIKRLTEEIPGFERSRAYQELDGQLFFEELEVD